MDQRKKTRKKEREKEKRRRKEKNERRRKKEKSNTWTGEKKGEEDRKREMNNAWGKEGKYLEGRAGGHPGLGDAGCHAEKHRDVRREGRERWSGGDPRDPDSLPMCRYISAGLWSLL